MLIGEDAVYETAVFVATQQGPYLDADPERRLHDLHGVESTITIGQFMNDIPGGTGPDNVAKDMHEEMVDAVIEMMDAAEEWEEGREEGGRTHD